MSSTAYARAICAATARAKEANMTRAAENERTLANEDVARDTTASSTLTDTATGAVAALGKHRTSLALIQGRRPVSSGSLFTDGGYASMLHVVQMARVFRDSKTFVDMKVVESQRWAQDAFNRLMERYDDNPPREAIVAFVADHFTMFDHMEEHVPDDWSLNPVSLIAIPDQNYRKFALDLNERWKLLR